MNRLAAVLSMFLVTLATGYGGSIREPVHSGTFYPADPGELRKTVEKMLDKAKKHEFQDRLIALIVPHAGIIYSGQVAAESFKQLQGRDEIKRVVIVAPSHYSRFRGISVYSGEGYRTPLGVVRIDDKLTQELLDIDREWVRYFPEAHKQEHAIEVELPFLQVVRPDVKIVAVVVGYPDSNGVNILRQIFSTVLEHDDTLILLSVDLSHYHSYDQARKLDTTGLETITALDPMAFAEKHDKGETEIDNPSGVMALLMTARALGSPKAKLLKYANSGDVTGDKSAVVGYASVAITAGKAAEDEEFSLSDEAKRELLRIARESIAYYLENRKPPKIEPHNKEILPERGAFVTLKDSRGELRGCIGYMDAIKPLYETVSEMAIAAATQDMRFPPVRSKKELDELEIEISVLSPRTLVTDPNEIVVGKHGLYITKAHKVGVLLPQVPVEQGWDREEFLKGVCRKAYLSEDAWKEKGTRLYKFSAVVFSEKEMLE